MVVNTIKQIAEFALTRLVAKLGCFDHVHGAPDVPQPLPRAFRWQQDLIL